jgi:hypothetical protein
MNSIKEDEKTQNKQINLLCAIKNIVSVCLFGLIALYIYACLRIDELLGIAYFLDNYKDRVPLIIITGIFINFLLFRSKKR